MLTSSTALAAREAASNGLQTDNVSGRYDPNIDTCLLTTKYQSPKSTRAAAPCLNSVGTTPR